MLNKLKNKLRQTRSNNLIFTIDFLTTFNDSLVLSGWFVSKLVHVADDDIKVFQNGRLLDVGLFRFVRPDVRAKYDIASIENCSGFLMVVNGIQKGTQGVEIKFHDKSLSLDSQRFRHVNDVGFLLSNLSTEGIDYQNFLTRHGLDSPSMQTTKTLDVRHRDKDVERIKIILQKVNLGESDTIGAFQNVLSDIHKIWKTKQSKNNGSELYSYGEMQNDPTVSIIVPLYGRYDFMQHQISHFSVDPEMRDAEVIYVLDDPTLEREALITANGLFNTFKFPFKLIVSERNRGFAGANNLGVEFSKAPYLLLLNSDILPLENGWLTSYLEKFESTEDVGILGATLLYEDNTIQHAGMEFREDSHYPGIWMNHHPYKGVPVELVSMEDVFESQTTTGACMLMKTSLYKELDGFDPLYVLGDFEDSDLCLKVINKGLKVYVSSSTRFYHLERLSQDLVDGGDWKFKLTLANGVYQTQKWGSLIKEVCK